MSRADKTTPGPLWLSPLLQANPNALPAMQTGRRVGKMRPRRVDPEAGVRRELIELYRQRKGLSLELAAVEADDTLQVLAGRQFYFRVVAADPLAQRNADICREAETGASLRALGRRWRLSPSSIHRIVKDAASQKCSAVSQDCGTPSAVACAHTADPESMSP